MKKNSLLALALVLIGLLIGAYGWVQGPSVGTVTTESKPASNVLASEITLSPWHTVHFTTQLPDTLVIKSSNESSSTSGSYLLTAKTGKVSDQVGIVVAELGNNSLDEIPAVKIRLNQPTNYIPTKRSFAPPGAYVFTTTDNTQTDIFWQHGTQYASVVTSASPQRLAAAEQLTANLITNWQWQ